MASTLGSTTKSRFVNSPEAHKLHIEFEVEAAQSVHTADPVVLANNGKVQAAASAAPAYTILGTAIDEVAAGNRVTISMRGYCRVYAEAAAASLNAGPVQLGVWNATTGQREYAAAAGADDAAKSVVTVGHNITQAAADGDAIHVVLLG
jgi:fructoselysine-6-P-deglycase FrlB-like protein